MDSKLRKEELVTLAVMAKKGQSNGQIAHVLGVSEGAVRYHRRRQGCVDGRRDKPDWDWGHTGFFWPKAPCMTPITPYYFVMSICWALTGRRS